MIFHGYIHSTTNNNMVQVTKATDCIVRRSKDYKGQLQAQSETLSLIMNAILCMCCNAECQLMLKLCHKLNQLQL